MRARGVIALLFAVVVAGIVFNGPRGEAPSRSLDPVAVSASTTATSPAPAKNPAAPERAADLAPDEKPGATEPEQPREHLPLLQNETLSDEETRARWEDRLAREDEELVQQAVGAGCDAARAARMRHALAEKRGARQRTLAELRDGKITRPEMLRRARATKHAADAAVAEILHENELAALDANEARLRVIERENQERAK